MKKRINITIDEKTLFIIDELAKDRGIDRSTMITLCIRQFDLDHDRCCDYYGDLPLDTPYLKAVFSE